ncbi:hypothetical protein BGZ47_009258 [Haplosporangium gracile]|nr:hypothetical protein BGZ47_009258 [Haplosporangium gracile]
MALFGIRLDDYFTDGKSIDSLVFQEGATPLSTQYEVAMWTISYFIVSFGGRQINEETGRFILTVASGAFLALFIKNFVPILTRHGLFYAICDGGAWTQRLELLYYLNYLVEYWELAGTVFLVLKKKLLVRIWWKQYLTTLHIVQFVLNLGFIYFPAFPDSGKCVGTEGAALFINLYRLTYNAKAKAAKQQHRGTNVIPKAIKSGQWLQEMRALCMRKQARHEEERALPQSTNNRSTNVVRVCVCVFCLVAGTSDHELH